MSTETGPVYNGTIPANVEFESYISTITASPAVAGLGITPASPEFRKFQASADKLTARVLEIKADRSLVGGASAAHKVAACHEQEVAAATVLGGYEERTATTLGSLRTEMLSRFEADPENGSEIRAAWAAVDPSKLSTVEVDLLLDKMTAADLAAIRRLPSRPVKGQDGVMTLQPVFSEEQLAGAMRRRCPDLDIRMMKAELALDHVRAAYGTLVGSLRRHAGIRQGYYQDAPEVKRVSPSAHPSPSAARNRSASVKAPRRWTK